MGVRGRAELRAWDGPVCLPEGLQLREGQQGALQQQAAGVAEVHLGQAEGAKHSPRNVRLDDLRDHQSHADGEAQKGDKSP